jgi:hypothetical protein
VEKEFRIISSRVADLDVPCPNSEIRECCKCGEDVWVSQNTKQQVLESSKGQDFEVVCSKCFANDGYPEDQEVMVATTGNEKLDEILQALGPRAFLKLIQEVSKIMDKDS